MGKDKGEESLESIIKNIFKRKDPEEITEFKCAKKGKPISPYPSFPQAYEAGIMVWLKKTNIQAPAKDLITPEVLYGFKIQMQVKVYERDYALLEKQERYVESKDVMKKLRDVNAVIERYIDWMKEQENDLRVEKEMDNFLLGQNIATRTDVQPVLWKEEAFAWREPSTNMPDENFITYVRQIGLLEENEERLSRWCQLHDAVEEERKRYHENRVVTLDKAYRLRFNELHTLYKKGQFTTSFMVLDEMHFLLKAIEFELGFANLERKSLPAKTRVASKEDVDRELRQLADRLSSMSASAESTTYWLSTLHKWYMREGNAGEAKKIEGRIKAHKAELDEMDRVIFVELCPEWGCFDLDGLYDQAVKNEQYLREKP
jgi:hypothetical protein